MSTLPLKVCLSCHAEYVHTATRCKDCDAELHVVEDSRPAEGSILPDPAGLSGLVRGGPWELERIARALSEAGIPSRIDSFPPGEPIESAGRLRGNSGHGLDLCVYVLPEHSDRAHQTLEQHRAATLPGTPGAGAVGVQLETCPACGTPFGAGAKSCSDCGLQFPAAVYLCECGSEVAADDEACPGCGTPLSEEGVA